MYMDGSLLNELEFFPPTDKAASSVAGGVQPNFGQGGLYQNEESVDFSSWLPDVFSEVPTASPQQVGNATVSTSHHRRSYQEAPTTTTTNANTAEPVSYSSPAAVAAAFGNYCSPPTPINMYDAETTGAAGVISLPHSRTTITSLADPNSLLMPPSNSLVGTRPAPGKAPKKHPKKKSLDKNTREYREKRERNNVAVRKSREKNRIQILDTQRRVKELEEENSALQGKITLLSKELKVLKDLFASAGVSQPASLCLKSEPEN